MKVHGVRYQKPIFTRRYYILGTTSQYRSNADQIVL